MIEKLSDKERDKQIADYTSGVHADTIDALTARDPMQAAAWYERYGGNLNERDKQRVPVRQNGRIAIPFNGYMIYVNGLEQVFDGHWSKKEPPAIAGASVGDEVVMCVTHLPDHRPPGDFRGIVYKTRDLRTGKDWEEGDSLHDCGGA